MDRSWDYWSVLMDRSGRALPAWLGTATYGRWGWHIEWHIVEAEKNGKKYYPKNIAGPAVRFFLGKGFHNLAWISKTYVLKATTMCIWQEHRLNAIGFSRCMRLRLWLEVAMDKDNRKEGATVPCKWYQMILLVAPYHTYLYLCLSMTLEQK